MTLFLIGAGGQLGSDLIRNNPGHELVAPTRSELDLINCDRLADRIRDTKPDWVINTAAFHNVSECERQPVRAFQVNCIAVRDLASICGELDVRLMTFSTDYVFGGEKRTPYTELDCPSPLQIYGISKLAGERAALAIAPEHVAIIRTCGLFGEAGAASKGGNFVDSRVADGRRGGVLEIASEQVVSPTSTHDLSRAVYALLEQCVSPSGIYHLVNEGACSWYEFTATIFECLNLRADLRPIDRGGRSGNVRRPRYSVLANGRARSIGVVLPDWRDALIRYLATKYAAR